MGPKGSGKGGDPPPVETTQASTREKRVTKAPERLSPSPPPPPKTKTTKAATAAPKQGVDAEAQEPDAGPQTAEEKKAAQLARRRENDRKNRAAKAAAGPSKSATKATAGSSKAPKTGRGVKRPAQDDGGADAPAPKGMKLTTRENPDRSPSAPPDDFRRPRPLQSPPPARSELPYGAEQRSRQFLVQVRTVRNLLGLDAVGEGERGERVLGPAVAYLNQAIDHLEGVLPGSGGGGPRSPDNPDEPDTPPGNKDGKGKQRDVEEAPDGPDDDNDDDEDGAPKKRDKGKGRAPNGYAAGPNGGGEVDGAADYDLDGPEDADESEAFNAPNEEEEEEDELATQPRAPSVSPGIQVAAFTLLDMQAQPFGSGAPGAITLAGGIFGPPVSASRGRGNARGGRGISRGPTRGPDPNHVSAPPGPSMMPPRPSTAADEGSGSGVEKPTSPKKPTSPQKKPKTLKLKNTRKTKVTDEAAPAGEPTSDPQPPAASPSRNTRSIGKTPPFVEPPMADDDLDPPKRNQKTKKRNSDELDLGKSADVKKRDRKNRGRKDEEPPKTVRRSGRKKGGEPEEEEEEEPTL